MKKISILMVALTLIAAAFATACNVSCDGEGNAVAVKGTNNIPKIQAELQKLESMTLVIGPQGEDGSDIQMIATVNEYGATIEITPKMAAWLAVQARELGLPKKTEKGNGYITIPERSFMRSTFDNDAALKKPFEQFDAAVMQIFTGEGTALQAANVLGNALVAAIKHTMRSNVGPANSEFTLARKGEGKGTLVDKARLFQSIGYEIKTA